ncbi:lysis system i-spanin subunit Rz [Pseudomonas fulva]|uniref:lysis system i-spanin subunit Rz n=1 Tax=Pseudomonas fulva TaxID=47880 RepID=UPI0034626E38
MGLNWRLAILVLLLGLYVGGRGAWLWQDNEYGRQLASKGRELADMERQSAQRQASVVSTVLEQVQQQQAKRGALEQRLQAQDQLHHKELTHAQNERDRLRDRLATADLRLSVLLNAGTRSPAGGDGGLRATAGAGGVVHGTTRAELDPAHTQRIISITGDGDDGLKALESCQSYVIEVTKYYESIAKE